MRGTGGSGVSKEEEMKSKVLNMDKLGVFGDRQSLWVSDNHFLS